MKKFLAFAGAAALAAGAYSLGAQLAQQPTPPPQVPAGVTPFVTNRHAIRAQSTDEEQSLVPTPPSPPADRRPAPPAVGRPSASDGASVDAIVAALYASVSHDSATEPNWPRMREIFLQVGMLIPPKNPRSDMFTVLDVDGFEQRVKESIAAARQKGDPTSFFEREIARRTDCFGNVCQVFSTYESRRAPSDEKPFVRGINSIQLVNDGRRWWIASVVWDTERADNPIPPQYLPNAPGTIPKEYLKK